MLHKPSPPQGRRVTRTQTIARNLLHDAPVPTAAGLFRLIYKKRSSSMYMLWTCTWRAVMVASARIVVMVTPHEKKEISLTAKRFGINVSELVRRSVRGFQPPQEETELEALLARVNASTKEANVALDDALRFVQESNRRIDAMPAGGK
jgi:hypothetical protein